jgi:hypothetical protein
MGRGIGCGSEVLVSFSFCFSFLFLLWGGRVWLSVHCVALLLACGLVPFCVRVFGVIFVGAFRGVLGHGHHDDG